MKDLKLGTDKTAFGFGEGPLGVGPFGDTFDFFHDILITDGDLELVSGGEEVAQSAKIAILFIRGDWFLNLLEGLPWFTEMFSTQVSYSRKRDLIKSAILETIGVIQLTQFTFAKNDADRNVEITFTVKTDFDTIENGQLIL
jgi:hypothetical protein